ncbi:Hypothetical Protein FCC1311_004382 [Hondaea fermentalgiana]|uniref:Uncharacterized protein n=1 Tax=Hondaea fermentalgiana TaxID=2315210 RepID=A0A2R5FZQ7_9STRA|nr:Hypothetical Protein FCC1311_004382 [Hondaea fermentalgiana]|eukprot:GBG24220.1 Hypothetical Protein FCC1311_004382 [Hondaea fermentalgiana]
MANNTTQPCSPIEADMTNTTTTSVSAINGAGLEDFDAWPSYYQHQNNAASANVYNEACKANIKEAAATMQSRARACVTTTKHTSQPITHHLQARLQQNQRRFAASKHNVAPFCRRTSSDTPKTSMEIFMTHVRRDEHGYVDASGIMSRECFEEWEASRKSKLKNPHLTFVHTVRSHVTGDPKTGRNPFPEDVEASLIKLFRRRQIWPCFRGTRVKYGIRGMFVTGYHEARNLKAEANGGLSAAPISARAAAHHAASRIEPITVKPLISRKPVLSPRSRNMHYNQHRVHPLPLQPLPHQPPRFLLSRPRNLSTQSSIDTDITEPADDVRLFENNSTSAFSQPSNDVLGLDALLLRAPERIVSDGREVASLDDDVATCGFLSQDECFEKEVLDLLFSDDYQGKQTCGKRAAGDWEIEVADLKKCKLIPTPRAASAWH